MVMKFSAMLLMPISEKSKNYTQKIWRSIAQRRLQGIFELDFLIDRIMAKIYLGELNPRVSGVSSLTNPFKICDDGCANVFISFIGMDECALYN